ncbi:hypothetical protein [Pseudomonas sp. EL_65y_Pfl2_R95]|uniref:hypothetical protein n=1 Tax=Pseudomonas sp. EL_65y_Pfl2_R95 TaxID=3088698 RepID=UPI0030DCDAEE
MSRRFNFTGRTKILREDVTIILDSQGNKLTCNVQLKLNGYDLKPDAEVVVEAERGRVLRIRHDWGHAGKAFTLDGASSQFDISSMGDPEDVRYRVLVVEPGSCRLLATAESVEAHNTQDGQTPQRSLLPIVMRDLHGGVWELENMGDTPTLVLDSALGTKQEIKSSPILLSLLPGVIRAILTYLAHDQQGTGDDESDAGDGSTSNMWLEQGKKWAGCPCPKTIEHSEIDDWAQKAVTGFSREKKLRANLANAMDMTKED